ncbi:NHLP bacteriocin export ABC transporter permease/ATPase subunit [Myxococcota bacterium]|nr:NHLP bacteriocin export ABC transporter permease/ATPase subunit [Myxococcota bacterium]
MNASELIDALTDLDDQGSACRFVDGVIASLIETISEFFSVPISARRLIVDSEVSLSAGEQIFADQNILWVQNPESSIKWGGEFSDGANTSGAVGGESFWIPVVPEWCWSISRDIDLMTISTSHRIRTGNLSRDIRSFHETLLIVGRSIYRKEDGLDQASIRRSQRVRDGKFDASFRAMTRSLASRKRHDSDATQTPVARAMEIVCRATGFALNLSEAESIEFEGIPDPVASIADRGGCLFRRVKLVGSWWREDHGPMLAFHGGSRQPVALLPRRNSKQYVLVEPVSGRSEIVDDAIAADMSSDGHLFFRSLPDGEISPWKLVRIGAFGSRRDLLRIGCLILLGGLLSLVLPVVTGWIMDPVIPNAELSNLTALTLAIAVTGVASVGFSYVQGLATLRIEGRMQNIVQSAVWDRLLKLPVDFFRNYSVGDLVNRADGIDSMRSFVSTSVLHTILHSVSIVFSLGLMLYYDWRLSLAVIVIALTYACLAIPVGFRFIDITRSMMNINGRLQGVVLQLLTAIQKIRIAGAEQHAFIHWSSRFSDLIDLTYRQRLLNNFLVVTKSIIRVMTIAIVIAVLAWQGDVLFSIFDPDTEWERETALGAIPLSTSHFISFHVALGQFMGGAFSLTELWVKLLNLTPVYERVMPILTASEENSEATEVIEDVSGRIEFANVGFSYAPDLPSVLNGVSFTVEPQQMVAIVGASGAGKSTVVRLLLGFEEPDFGSIYIDDKDLRSIDKKAMRKRIGAVLQESRILSGSIFHNIAGGSGASLDDAWEAARLAGIARDIEAMPMGMETFLGEGATNISGGQRQRIAAARALVGKPRLVVFDEATSALDNETQRHVSESIGRLNATRFVVAHRLSTIVGADQILVMDKGRIVESGSYEELLAKEGSFTQLARRQIL